uniref:Atlastin 2 n=1 Tax=Rhipicephalus appendiculatus TaxID=34631 RepID=A0A131Z2P0_RHIAP
MGKQEQIVSFGEDQTIQLNKDALERILLAPKVRNKPVAVVSITGAFREGKSFLLNFLLRYLASNDKTNWMGDDDTPLEGFSWSTSSERNTEGIHLWDEVFLVPTPEGGELAVLLMDTQGAFDSESSADETTKLFALSILTSSLQICNILHNLREDHLQHLQLVAEYGMHAKEDTKGYPFQRLVLLIRDWQYPDDNAYGATGGLNLLKKFMSSSTGQHRENKDLRERLPSCFSSFQCFLMPNPGKETTRKSFDGSLRKLDEDFEQQLGVLVPWLVAAENLEAKKIAGKTITCQQLMNYLTAHVDVLKDGKRVRVATMLQATVEESNRNAKDEATTFYAERLRQLTYNTAEELEERHKVLLEEAKQFFLKYRKMGDRHVERKYLDMLEKDIKEHFVIYSFEMRLSVLEVTEKQVMERLNALHKRSEELKQEETELQRQREQLASSSTDVTQKLRELEKKKAVFKQEREELTMTTDELRDMQIMLEEERKQVEEKKTALLSVSKKTILGTAIATALLVPSTAALTVFAPPAGIALGAVTAAVIGTLAKAASDKARLTQE